MMIHIMQKEWLYKGKEFNIEVKRWQDITRSDPHKFYWNVYVYIFPNHPLFDDIINDQLGDYGVDFPLHCGASYHKWFYNATGKVTSKRIGSDYCHCDDERYEHYADEDDAWEVFRDADELIEFMERFNKG